MKAWFTTNRVKADDRKYYDVPRDMLYIYGKYDVIATRELFKVLSSKLAKDTLRDIYEHEQRLIRPLLAVEERGVRIDVPKLRIVRELFRKMLATMETDLAEATGHINLNSTKQLAGFL